jgi:hypothetical protein
LNLPNAFPQPRWGLSITNRVRCMIIEPFENVSSGTVPNGRVVDYVQLDGLNTYRDLTADIERTQIGETGIHAMWQTNNVRTYGWDKPQGVNNQIEVSLGNEDAGADWRDFGIDQYSGITKSNAIDEFRVFMKLSPLFNTNTPNTNYVMQAPFTPTAKMYQTLTWQINDPLVHYLTDDLKYLVGSDNLQPKVPPNSPIDPITAYFTTYTTRFDPWGGNRLKTGGAESSGNPNAFNIALKDPMMRASDDWDFPTNVLPNLGWLGRVHRGTPWQTIYLKASDLELNVWREWSGDSTTWTVGGATVADASVHRPINDRMLFDVFTTGMHGNATRGRMSVNQTGLAAWSAVLSGIIVLTNTTPDEGLIQDTVLTMVGTNFIQPAGIYDNQGPLPPLVRIVQGINHARTNTNPRAGTVFRNQTFQRAGDVLAAPELSEKSPYLNLSEVQKQHGLRDELYERIPQQMMSLVTLTRSPRFVIYSYGQTLHPAERSIVTAGGPFFGLCTNYQITAETATRAVVRVDGSFDPQYRSDVANPRPDPYGRFYPPHVVVEQYNVLPPD